MYKEASCGGRSGNMGWMATVDPEKAYDQSLYCQSASLVRIAGSKSDLFPVRVGLCPFVTDSVHNFYGQNF